MTAVGGVLAAAAAVGAGLAGGVYFTFTAIVLPALRRRSAIEAVAVMQRANERAVRAPFMIVFFGGAIAACAAAGTGQSAELGDNIVSLRVIGASLALASVGTTIVFNVPLNNALARVHPSEATALAAWRSFDAGWSRANALRTVLAVASSALFAASLSARP
jgi:uncharacterized membrane protein